MRGGSQKAPAGALAMSAAGANEAYLGALQMTFAEHADPVAALPMQAYMKSAMPFFGIAAPLRRRLSAEVAQAHPCADIHSLVQTAQRLWDAASHREQRYAAMVSHDFFIRKGMGWALRERSYAAPDEVLAFVAAYASGLSPLTQREALRVVHKRRSAISDA
jgi:3-methyladenine DNA glycosylase AlkD